MKVFKISDALLYLWFSLRVMLLCCQSIKPPLPLATIVCDINASVSVVIKRRVKRCQEATKGVVKGRGRQWAVAGGG